MFLDGLLNNMFPHPDGVSTTPPKSHRLPPSASNSALQLLASTGCKQRVGYRSKSTHLLVFNDEHKGNNNKSNPASILSPRLF
jgi:hypothetical protein